MQVKRMRTPLRALAALLLVALAAPLFATGASAASTLTGNHDYTERSFSAVSNTRAAGYDYIPVRTEAGTEIAGRLINGTTYVAIRAFSDAVADCEITYNAATRTATVEAEGLWLTATDKSNYIVANGRYLAADMPVRILDDNSMYLPIRQIAKAFGVGITWNGATRSVTVTGTYTPLESGDSFYNADDLYWLSRIISAESRGEPLIGQIAVGNVVMNRVEDPAYPNSIWGVIFDKKGGVQFSPTVNGTVYNKPYWLSVVAAKIVLEGYTLSEDILYFFEPSIASSFWIAYNCDYVFTIGCHYFYKD